MSIQIPPEIKRHYKSNGSIYRNFYRNLKKKNIQSMNSRTVGEKKKKKTFFINTYIYEP